MSYCCHGLARIIMASVNQCAYPPHLPLAPHSCRSPFSPPALSPPPPQEVLRRPTTQASTQASGPHRMWRFDFLRCLPPDRSHADHFLHTAPTATTTATAGRVFRESFPLLRQLVPLNVHKCLALVLGTPPSPAHPAPTFTTAPTMSTLAKTLSALTTTMTPSTCVVAGLP